MLNYNTPGSGMGSRSAARIYRPTFRVCAFLNEDAPATNAVKASRKASAAKTSTKEEPSIKRAPSAYNLYVKSEFHVIQESAGAGSKAKDLMHKLSEMWKALSDEEKGPFLKQASELKAEVEVKRGAAKAKAKENAKPASPYTSYIAGNFASFKKDYPTLKATEIIGKMAAAWKALPVEDKAAMKEEYTAKVIEWKAKQPELQE